MQHFTCHMSHVTCHISNFTVTLHMSHLHFTCHMSHVTCHMSSDADIFVLLLHNIIIEGCNVYIGRGGEVRQSGYVFCLFLFSATPFDHNFLVKIRAVQSWYFNFLQDPTLLNFLPKQLCIAKGKLLFSLVELV